MLGRNPLWVARQHGHSLLTMLRVYAAWTEDMLEHDVALIREAMGFDAGELVETPARIRENDRPWPAGQANWSVNWPIADVGKPVSTRQHSQFTGGKGGTRTRDRGEEDQ